ncbi:MAG: hypothetical protein M5U34_00665 [Chloroflexi bacterium]|nr:hypothetical protein [Chloroflexota bacterium]
MDKNIMKSILYIILLLLVLVACQSSRVTQEIIREAPTKTIWTTDQQKIINEIDTELEGAIVTDLWNSGKPPSYSDEGDKTWCVTLENKIDVWIGAQIRNTDRLIVYYTTNSQNIFKPIQIYPGDKKGWDFWECEAGKTE